MRPLLIPLTALLAWALTAPARAPEPPAARAAPALGAVQVVRTRAALGASWQAVDGQALVCAFRVAPPPQEPLEPCLRGPGGSLALAVPRDTNLQVWPGDTVELRAYGDDGALLAVGRATVADGWLTWFPALAR